VRIARSESITYIRMRSLEADAPRSRSNARTLASDDAVLPAPKAIRRFDDAEDVAFAVVRQITRSPSTAIDAQANCLPHLSYSLTDDS
jgi:hypothetical protein